MSIIDEKIQENIEHFKTTVSISNGTGDICRKYNFNDNGKSRNTIKKYISEYDLDISHFGIKSHPIKYPWIEKECPICKTIFNTQQGHPRETSTCSTKCSNTHFKSIRYTEASKKKQSDAIKKYNLSIGHIPQIKSTKVKTIRHKLEYNCKFCSNKYYPCRVDSKYCSNKCSAKDRINNLEYRKRLSDANKILVANGTHKGWKPRSNPSYAELFFMTVLKNNNIDYKHDERCGKYYIDFAIENKKIALEIDGKQHKYPDRMLKDAEKDKYLLDNGWKVYRIEWNTINTDDGKKLMKEKIDKFIEYYGN